MIRILFLTADPTYTPRLRLQRELRDIEDILQGANQRERFVLKQRLSTRVGDISGAILDFKPHIVHFSGHGTSTGELCFEDESGTMQPVKPKALAALFELVADQVNCVVLNACYSDIQAKAIAKHISFVIGMKQAISDQAAIAFAVGFYKAVRANPSIEDAFNLGCIQIQLQGIAEELIPVLHKKDDPSQAQTVAQELIRDKNVLGVIGHASSVVSQAALPKYQNAGLAMISSSSTSTELSMKKFKVFFRTIPSDKIAGERLAKYAINHGIKKVVIYYQPGEIYSESFKNEFAKSLEDQGGKVVRTTDFADRKLNALAEASLSVFNDEADATVFLPKFGLLPTVINIAREQQKIQAKLQKQKKIQLLGGASLYSSETLKQGKEAIEGLVVAVPWFMEEPNSKNFAYQACERWEGGVSWLTAASYDATQAFTKAMSESGNPSRSTVLEKLKSIKLAGNETSGDPLNFKDGERDEEPVLVKVVKGSGSRNPCWGFQEGGFHFEKVPKN